METLEPTREWRRKRYRRTRHDWIARTGLALMMLATVVVVAVALVR